MIYILSKILHYTLLYTSIPNLNNFNYIYITVSRILLVIQVQSTGT